MEDLKKGISEEKEVNLNFDEDMNYDEESVDEVESLSGNTKILSPGRMVLKRFFRSKLSIIGLCIIIFLFAFSFLGPLVMQVFGYRWGELTMDKENIKYAYDQYKFTYEYDSGSGTEEFEVYAVTVSEVQNAFAKPSSSHWLGTDKNTMDMFVRLMHGGRISLILSFMVVFMQAFIGIILGSLAGYFGKVIDQIVMRIVDILFCIPHLPIMLIVGASIGGLAEIGKIPDGARIYLLMFILTLLGWAGIARLVRGQILMLREQEFMVAAEALGLSVPRKIFKHLLPNILPQLIVSMTLGLGGVILMESSLSYLGLGVQPPRAAWGTMISEAKDPAILEYYINLWVPPGILIVLAVLGFNFVGDGLRDAFDPKAKR